MKDIDDTFHFIPPSLNKKRAFIPKDEMLVVPPYFISFDILIFLTWTSVNIYYYFNIYAPLLPSIYFNIHFHQPWILYKKSYIYSLDSLHLRVIITYISLFINTFLIFIFIIIEFFHSIMISLCLVWCHTWINF